MNPKTLKTLIAATTARIADARRWNRERCLPHQRPIDCWALDDLKAAAVRVRGSLERGKPIPERLPAKIEAARKEALTCP